MPAPVLLAPIGVQSIVHPEAELAVGRAAAALGLTFILSTAASHAMEEVAEAVGDASRWYQLYWPRDRDLAESFLGRAEEAGYGAVVVTLDTWMLGWRPRDLQHAYLPFLKGEGVANYFSDPVFRAALERPPEEDLESALGHWAYQFSNPAVTWADLEWLRDETELPILLKGILHADDARRAVQAGVDGLIVSNHGGRQVDGSVGALDALADVRRSGRRRTGGAVRQRRAHRRRRLQGARAGRRSGVRGAAVRVGPRTRRPGGGRRGAALPARGARPDARPERLHDARRGGRGAAETASRLSGSGCKAAQTPRSSA